MITKLHPIAVQAINKKWLMTILCIQVEQIFQPPTARLCKRKANDQPYLGCAQRCIREVEELLVRDIRDAYARNTNQRPKWIVILIPLSKGQRANCIFCLR